MTEARNPPLPDVDEALRIAGLNLRSLFDQFPFAVQVFSPDGRVLYSNPMHRELWGHGDDERRPDYVIFESPQLVEMGLMPFIRRGFAGETVALPPTRYTPVELPTLPGGRPRWVRTLIYPIKDEIGSIRAVVVMHIDITEREETQQTLEQRVEERTRELSTLLGVARNVASTLDLNALLGVILEQLKTVADYSGYTIAVTEGDGYRILDDRGGVAPDQPNPELVGRLWPLLPTDAIWQAINRREAVIVDDVRGDGPFARAYRAANADLIESPAIRHVRSWLAVPLEINDRVIGLISISKDEPGAYSEYHARLARAVGTHVAAAIENARLYERERRTAEELATLLEVSRTATSTLELEPLLGVVLDRIKLVLDYTSAVVITPDGDGFRTAEYRGPLPREVVLSRPVNMEATAENEAAYTRGEAVIIADVWDSSDASLLYRSQMGEEYLRTTASYLRCLMIAPLMLKGELVGGLVVTHQTPGYYTAHHARLAQAIANQVAGAIENARLFEQQRRTAQELSTLLEVSRTVSSTLDLQTLLGVIADQIKVVADYHGMSVLLLEGQTMRTVFRRAPVEVQPEHAGVLATPLSRAGVLADTLLGRQPLIIDDVRADEPLARAYREMIGDPAELPHLRYMRAWMAVPLALTDRVIGLIVIAHGTPGYYSAHQGELVQAIAAQAAIAVENARLYEQQRQTAQELASLLEVSRAVSSTLDLQALLGVIVDQIKVVADHDGATVLLVQDDALHTLYRRVPPEIVPADPGVRVLPFARMGDFFPYLLRREAAIIADVRGDEPLAVAYRRMMGGDPAEIPHLRYVRAWLAVPLATQDRLVGLLVLGHSTPGYYTPRHAELVTAIASQVAGAIENAHLYGEAQKLAALEERQRLARELHDSVSQVLFSIGLGARTTRTLLERGDPGRALPSVDYILNLAEMGTAEMRALLFELRPESLAQEGLVAAITKQAAALRARHSIAVDATLCEEPDVPLDLKEAVYRIAQEATHNTVKHARAGRITVGLACDERGIALDVRDDGRGFDPGGSFPGHLGLRSMRERVERLGGTLTIESAPGAGTAIHVRIPIPRTA